MVDHKPGTTAEESASVEKLWYVAAPVRVPRGWLVYTLDFALATLQGCVTEPENVRRTTGWLVIGVTVRCAMAVAQAILMLFAWLPITSSLLETFARVYSRNALGFFLRACYWKAKLKDLGQDTIIDQYVDMWGARAISIGSRCHIDTGVRLAAGERRHGQHGSIRIGNFVHIGPGVHIAGRGGVDIRDYVGIMANAHLYSATGVAVNPSDPGQLISISHMAPPDRQHIVESPILIDRYAFVGMMARILPGVTVGFGAVVHANCELTDDVPPFANFGGVPGGRLIGWRRPRRPSPRLKTAIRYEEDAAEVGETRIHIREVTDPNEWATIEGVMDLHFDAFRDGVTTQLGHSFVFRYYTAIITSERCSLWIAETENRVVGFLGVTTDRHAFERINRSGATRLLAAWRFCTFRLSLFAVLRALRKHQLSHHYTDRAELLSIVVAPTVRRAGLGKRFLAIWHKKLAAEDISSFIVFTDNPEGMKFYEKYGGDCLFRFRLRSLWSACFRFLTDADTPVSQDKGGRPCAQSSAKSAGRIEEQRRQEGE